MKLNLSEKLLIKMALESISNNLMDNELNYMRNIINKINKEPDVIEAYAISYKRGK